jgi:dolichol-phosphate mannosyltransferase
MNTLGAPRISIVVPVYGCASCLEQLCTRLKATLDGFASWYEIILVDDRSPDNSWNNILQLKSVFAQVRGIRLSRNYGQHIAITAGLAAARGDVAVVMDCDLQDPPEKIPDLYAALQNGADLVLARRAARAHSALRTMAGKVYFKLLGSLSDNRVDGSYGTFSILSRKVIDAFLQFGDRDRHYLFILRWLGFSIGSIDYDHQARASGCSAYSFRRLIRHAVDGLFFQATVLLRWIVGLGLAFAAGGILLAIYFVYHYFADGAVAGWTSLFVLVLTCTGVILTCLGVIGLYIGKIFEQTKIRPLYVIDIDTVGNAS